MSTEPNPDARPATGSEPRPGIRTTRDGAVMRIAFDRAERRNAITRDMYSAMSDALDSASAEDSGIKVLLVHGNAQMFTAGNDLADFVGGTSLEDVESPVRRFLGRLAALDVPLVAAVCGPAVGIGSTVLLHCDLVYAGDNARFAFPFVNLGLCPEAGSSVLLPALVGRARASEKLLFGEAFGADEALALGIVNQVLPADEVIAHALQRCHELARRPLQSLRVTRRLLRLGTASAVSAAMSEEFSAFARMLGEPAAREAINAFMQKRRPDFGAL